MLTEAFLGVIGGGERGGLKNDHFFIKHPNFLLKCQKKARDTVRAVSVHVACTTRARAGALTALERVDAVLGLAQLLGDRQLCLLQLALLVGEQPLQLLLLLLGAQLKTAAAAAAGW